MNNSLQSSIGIGTARNHLDSLVFQGIDEIFFLEGREKLVVAQMTSYSIKNMFIVFLFHHPF